MCLAILFHRYFSDAPLALAANREEAYDRPALAPHWWGDPPVFAGRDQRAGGTWLGVNRAGLLVALTNRVLETPDAPGRPHPTPRTPAPQPPPPQTRSRGQLCVDALRRASAGDALAWAQSHLAAQSYNPFNLLLADGASAWVVHWDGAARVTELAPGIHYLAETDVDDSAHPRITAAQDLVQDGVAETWTHSLPALRRIMGTHQADLEERARLCRHLGRSGTVSSALVALPATGLQGATFEHAPGPPCTSPCQDLTGHLRQELG